MSKIVRSLCHSLFYLLLMANLFVSQAIADPVIVAQTGANSDLSNPRQIVRTSTGRIYYLGGNAGHTSNWDGWLEVHASSDGASWSKESTRDQWYLSSDIGVSIDSKNVLHVVSYDWNHHPYYVRYNTADSPTANFTWDGYELLESTKTSDVGKCAVAVDANGKPHVVYQSLESYKGQTYYTLTYANRVGTAWSKVAIWPKELKTNFNGKIEIAIGLDNIPYILAGNKMLKGNTNTSTSFETKDLGSAGTSFVIQQNGDIKVARISNGNYSVNSHDHASPWSSGWTLAESTTPDTGSILLLANDTLYAARLRSDGIWLQKNFDPPFLAASQPANTAWQSLTARWSFLNNSKQGAIDLGTRSWNQQNGNLIWYSANLADSRANFYGGPFLGVAPLTVTFSDSSIPREGSNITSWQWDFENDGADDASGPNATHLYTTPGKYSVSLAITDSSGGQDKIVRPSLVQVDGDSDGDGILDSLDNCPIDYNPMQIDFNGNGIGDVCEPDFNMNKAFYMTSLRSNTAADKNMQDVTGIMTDDLLNQWITLSSTDNNVASVQLNKDARDIKKLILRMYINDLPPYNPEYPYASLYVQIMPYSSDLVTPVSGLIGGWNGWNEFDLTSLAHRMDGYGVVKFRIAARSQSSFRIYEMELIEKADSREIAATPTAVEFGAIEVTTSSTREFTISNNGTESLNIVRVKSPSWPFSVDYEDCSGKFLANSQKCIVKVSFSPLTDSQYHDAVTIDSNDVESSSFKVPLQGNGTLVLRGMVKDSVTGNPLNAIRVDVTDSVKTYTAITDINGVYVISGLASGSYAAKFSRADYVTQTINGTISQSQKNTLDALLSLNFASIGGVVSDLATGSPLAGAKVILSLSGITSKDPADRQNICNDDHILAPAENVLVENNDSNKFSCKHTAGWPSINGKIKFRVRNPYGKDPFTVRWNGVATMGDYFNEYLAQGIKPTKSGPLSRVGFYLNSGVTQYFSGEVHVLLKSALGGDRGTYLAKSNSIYLNSNQHNTPQWIYFDFPTPTSVVAGQQYYLEINGTYFEFYAGGMYIYTLNWGQSDQYPNDSGYRRAGGFWIPMQSLAFQTTIGAQSDINAASNGTLQEYMCGSNITALLIGILPKDGSNSSQGLETNIDSTDDGDGYWGKYNGDDLTALVTINDMPGSYYDTNGWIEVLVSAYSSLSSDIVTDQFNLTFNRTITATTDANGAYSFQNLPDGDYTVVIDKTAYGTEVIKGGLQPGQVVSINRALSVNSDMRIITNTLSVGSVRNYYNQSMAATGGRAPYKWSLIAGALPSGLALDGNTGVISGLPTSAYNNTIVLQVQDANNKTVAKAFTLRIFETFVPSRISVSPSTVSFGGAIIGKILSNVVTVTNTGTTDLVIGKLTQPSEPFQVMIDNCSNKTLATAAACTITIQFSPTQTGSFYENIDIPSSDENYPIVSVYISGAGIINYFLPDTGRGELVKNPLNFALDTENSATDRNTHLMWQRSGSAAAMTWSEAGAYCRDLALDGYNDWRLPSFLELTTIVNYGAANPAIASEVFPGTSLDNYWTASEWTGQNPELYAGVVNFAYGEAHPLEKATGAFTRCTRGETLTNTLRVTGGGEGYPYTNGVISTDQSTGLVWAGNPIAFGFDPYICDPLGNCVSLSQINDCRILLYAGKQDWRNPTIKELATLSGQPCFLESCTTISATTSGRPDALGNLSNVYMFSPNIDIISAPPSTNHGLSCVSGGNQAWGISGLAVSGITANSAVISWDTSQPANGEVQYGETSAYGSSTINTTLTTQHTITVGNLTPETTYHYRVASTNVQGVAMHSDDLTFTTPRFSASNLGDSGNVNTMEISGSFDGKNPDGSQNDQPRKAVATEYFKNHPDKDFLVFFSTFNYAMPEGEAKGFYTEVKNDTQGVNRTILDNSSQYGSAGMLQGTIDMGNITQLAGSPYSPKLEETLTTLSHELGHRWLAAVRFKNPDGSLNTSLLGKDSAHWSYLLDSKGSLMYGNGWKDNGNGTFTSVSKQSAFSPLDLYLMGMIPKEQVPPMLLIDNPSIDKMQLPQLGATVTGTAKTVTIDDIIAAEGARVPDSTTAQKLFNVGFVLLTRAGDSATAATQAIETLRKAWAGRFAELTQGKGGVSNVAASLEIAVDSPTDGATITGPDVTVNGSVINSTGAETGVVVNGMPATVNGSRFIANHVPLQIGSNTITVAATDASGLTSATAWCVTAQAGNYIRITSNIDSGTGPMDISLRLDGSFNITNPTMTTSGPVPVTLTVGASSSEFTAKLTVEGTYTITASAVGPDGQIYSDTVTITVTPRYLLENLLEAKWEGMKQKISTGDIQGAGTYFPQASREMFLSIFGDTTIDSVSRLNDVSAVKIYTLSDYYAQGGLIRQDEDGEFSYPITFSRDEVGLWRIYNF